MSDFRYVGGCPALDFINTVDWEGDAPIEGERFVAYPDLIEWAVTGGSMDKRTASRLLALADADPAAATRALTSALRARGILRSVMREVALKGKPSRETTESFNRLLRSALAHAILAPVGSENRWSWEGRDEDLTSVLWPVVWEAADLLASKEASQIRECSGENCGWIYVDRSRPRNRRWCEMETCGNREKARRHYHRTHSH
jgi:predicted RNA-binding Zn ribbon-like protein